MTDLDTRLTELLDDVAAHVHPHADPDAIFRPVAATVPNRGNRWRPGIAAAVAAGIVLLGGSAWAAKRLTAEPSNRVSSTAPERTKDGPEPSSTTEPHPATTVVPVTEPQRTVPAVVPVVEPSSSTEPTTEAPTTVAPAVIEFTAKLGVNGMANNPPTQRFSGKAQPGSTIRIATSYGVAETTANDAGAWEATLTMREVPAGGTVAVRITSSTSDRVREFTLVRPVPPPPAVIEFTAKLGANGQAATPMTQGFFGTAQPGSAIRVGSDWGVAETTANADGTWAATLVLPDVPAGTTVGVRITSSTSDRVREFTLQRPGEAPPVTVAFTAKAAQTVTDHTPPVNEYSGTATAGSVISISSPYGSAQVTANGDGRWTARVEFPGAPLGQAFNVHVASSKSDASYDFSLTPISPG